MADGGVSFVSLCDLLGRGRTVGVLATAIEQSGVHGWDRFGRFKHFSPSEDGAARALEALAAEYEALERDEIPPSDWDEFDSDYSRFGWPEARLPDFDAIAAGMVKAPRPQAVAKTENGHLTIIGALLWIIEGGRGAPAHPEFVSRSRLIDLIHERFGQTGGLSRSNLSKKLAEADKTMKMR